MFKCILFNYFFFLKTGSISVLKIYHFHPSPKIHLLEGPIPAFCATLTNSHIHYLMIRIVGDQSCKEGQADKCPSPRTIWRVPCLKMKFASSLNPTFRKHLSGHLICPDMI